MSPWASFRQITWLEQHRGGEHAASPLRSPSPQASIAPTPTPPPGHPGSVDEQSSSQKKKVKKKKGDVPDSPMPVDTPSPSANSKGRSRKDSVTQNLPPQINTSKKKQVSQSRRGTASSVEPSPANLVMQLPPHTTTVQAPTVDSPQSVQASPNPTLSKKEDSQSTLGIGPPPSAGHSPAPTHQQVVSGPPKKRMKTETPSIGSIPLPGAGSQQGTPQQAFVPLTPQTSAPAQHPNPAQPSIHRYSASPAPPPAAANNQPTQQYPGQLMPNYGPLGLSIANGMMVNNGTGYSTVPGMQQPQVPNIHASMFAAQSQHQQAASQAGSPHSLPPSRPASQASMMRNSPRPPAPTPLGGNPAGSNLQVPQPDQQGLRPASAPGQQGMQPNPGIHQPANPMAMSIDPMQMAVLQQMQAQRMAFPGAQNMMQYPGFPMQIPGQPWRVQAPGQMPMGVGRGQTAAQLQQYAAAAAMQRRNAMQAPPNPPR